MKTSCEALVIGGGPAGAVAAALLAQAGWSVVVLERKSFPRRKVCGEYLSATNWPLLTQLGLDEAVHQQAGPAVRRVGLFVGEHALTAELPLSDVCGGRWGRALSRERLDSLLLNRAAALGAEVLQPWDAQLLTEVEGGFVCRAASTEAAESREIKTPIVIAAHGSWELGHLPTQLARRRPRAGDLLGFKTHFEHAALPDGLMPLLSFPGGYGGMVHVDEGRISLSCCVRREQLEQIQRTEGRSDGEAVRAHIEESTPAVRRVLETATTAERWLSAGPIRPGIRDCYRQGIFRVGNAAGEAHPAVAEGITMAMQSAQLLAEHLGPQRDAVRTKQTCDVVGRNYTHAWRVAFARRIRVSGAIANWAMRPTYVKACLPIIKHFPKLLTWGARQSGKIDFPSRYEATTDAGPLSPYLAE